MIFKYLGNSDIRYGSNSDTPNDEFSDTLHLLTTDEDFNEVYREMTEFIMILNVSKYYQ